MKSLTEGSPVKLLLGFSIPYLMVNLFQQIYNIADTLIVGRILGTNAMTAVGSTGNLMWLTAAVPTSLCLGFSMLTAQFFGAKNENGIKKSFANSIVIAVFATAILSVFGSVFLYDILELFNFPAEIINDTHKYFIWIMIGLVPNTVFFLNSSMMRALGESKSPMYFSVISCVINIVLDYVLIADFKMGTEGAGIATFISQVISAILSSVFLFRSFPALHFGVNDLVIHRETAKSLLKLGIPVAFFDLVNASGGIVSTFAVNSLGIDYVTAITAATKICSFCTTPIFAIGSAVTVYAAQNYGAKEYIRIKQGANAAIVMMLIWNAFVVFFSAVFSKPIISFVANTESDFIINSAYTYLIWVCAGYVFVDGILVYRSTIQACGRSVVPVISSFGELFGRILGVFYLVKAFGFIGVILIGPLAWLMGMVINAIGYFKFIAAFKNIGNET